MDTRTTPMLDEVMRLASEQGWTVQSEHEHGASITSTIVRGDQERIMFHSWGPQAQGGNGQIRSYAGQIMAGTVAVQQIRGEGFLSQDEVVHQLAKLNWAPNCPFELQVQEGEYEQGWETASNYTVHRLRPGRYPIEFVTVDYRRVDMDRYPKSAYYAIARVPTDEIRRFYINRVLTASSAHDEAIVPPRKSSILWAVYAYEVRDRRDDSFGLFQVVPV